MQKQTEAFREMLKLRRDCARHEITLQIARERLVEVERTVQREQGKCACWLPQGDDRCICGVVRRRDARRPIEATP